MVNVNLAKDEYFKTYKFKIYPTKEQATQIDRYIELSRYIFNWALGRQNDQRVLYANGEAEYEFLTKWQLEREFTELRNTNGYEFLKDIPHISGRLAIWTLMDAINMYKRGINNYPNFKKKKDKSDQSFKLRADRTFFDGKYLITSCFVQNPIYVGFETNWKKDYSRNDCPKFYNPVIVRDIDNSYYITVGIIEKKPLQYFKENNIEPMGQAIGIDLNIDKRIQLSNGKVFRAPDIEKEIRQLKRAQRKTVKDRERLRDLQKTNPDATPSKRSIKRAEKYQKKARKISNITENFIQTSTKEIIKMNPSAVVMENLDNNDMVSEHYMAKQIAPKHCNFYRIREVMEQKCNMYGIEFKLADKTYPSSQLCSNCGYRQKIGTSKIYKCPNCGMEIDRDLNAAKNLEKLAYSDKDNDVFDINDLVE